MMLVEETKRRFGYDPAILTRGSHFPVVGRCSSCGGEIVSQFRRHKDRCRSCAISENPNIASAASKRLKQKWADKDPLFARLPRLTEEQERKRIENLRGAMASRDIHLPQKEVVSRYGKFGYEVLSEYTGFRDPLQVKCPRGHAFTSAYYYFHIGNRCPVCREPKAQKDLFRYVVGLGFGDAIYNARAILENRLQLDIFIPSKRIAIEYCGLHWHSDQFRDDSYHLRKMLACQELGIRLITIFSDEWTLKNSICRRRIEHALGLNEESVGARLCEVKQVDSSIAREFCESNHLQGAGKTTIAHGLYLSDSLVSVMCFAPTSIAKGGDGSAWEISRFCSSRNVAGGGSRLFKAFLRNHSPEKVVSYCDLRWGTGDFYRRIGMRHVHDSKPNYWYLVNNEKGRVHRFAFRKDRLVSMGGDESKTERELAGAIKLYRIYDCGNSKYVWTP